MTLIDRRTLRAASCAAAVGLAALAGCSRSDGAAATTAAATAAPSIAPPSIAPPTTAPPAATAAPNTTSPASTSTGPTDEGSGSGNGGSGMTDEAIKAAIDPRGESTAIEVLARGDVDGDGDEDAVVLATYCGASCGSALDLLLNEPTGPIPFEYSGDSAFVPWFTSGGAAQSSVTAATIDGSTITVTGTGLCGDLPVVETDEPGACNYTTERTATYLFNNGAIEPISIEPEPG